jgi:hypothetical protein
MKELASNELSKLKKEHQGEIEKLKSDYESMKMNYENKIVQNVEQVQNKFRNNLISKTFLIILIRVFPQWASISKKLQKLIIIDPVH